MVIAVLVVVLQLASTPDARRFDLRCEGAQTTELPSGPGAPEPWSARISVDLERGAAHREGEPENIRLKSARPGEIVFADATKGFGDAVVSEAASYTPATGRYRSRSTSSYGALTVTTVVAAACTREAFTRLSDRDAPDPAPEPH